MLKKQYTATFDTIYSPQRSTVASAETTNVSKPKEVQYIEKVEKKSDYDIIDQLTQRWLRREPNPTMEKLAQELRVLDEQRQLTDGSALRSLSTETQDLILALADRIRSIRLTDQTDAQPPAPPSLERVTPPLPTAEDISETWVNRSSESREAGETPLSFFQRVYAPWVGVITKGHIRHIDPSLYTAFNNWTKKGKNTIPEAILPNQLRRWGNVSTTPDEIKIYNKINAIRQRRSA